MSNEIFNNVVTSQFDGPFDEELAFKVVTSDTEGGKEYRYSKWLYPRRSFSVNLDGRNRTEIGTLWDFFKRHTGSYDTFLLESPNDSSSSNPVTNDVFATGDGVGQAFYLGNKFLIPTGDCYLLDPIQISKDTLGNGTFVVKSEGADYALTRSLGQVVFTTPPASGDQIRADSYRFCYRVRFKDSSLSRSAFAYELWNSGVGLIQVI